MCFKKFKEKFKFSDNCEIIFTDGSRREGNKSTGLGLVVHGRNTGFTMSIDARCSVYSAESLAVEKAIGFAIENNWYSDLLILSDNQGVIQDVGSNKLAINKHRVTFQIREKIFEYLGRAREMGNTEVKLVLGWVPAHRGIVGNEDADEIAKGATEEPKDPRIMVPPRDWRSLVKEKLWKSSNAILESEGSLKGIKYFSSMYRKDKKKPWFSNISLERGLVNMINRLRANHYNLNESLFRKNYIDSPRCECGAESQDIDHVILRCVQHDDARNALYSQLEALKVKYPYDVTKWTEGPDIAPLRKMWTFLKKIHKVI